jgi:hypothetical protein
MTVADPSPETPDNAAPESGTPGLPTTSNPDASQVASSTTAETGAETAAPAKGADESAGDAPKPKSAFEAAKAAMAKDKGADPSSADAKPNQQPKPDGKGDEPVKPEGAKPEGEKAEIPQEFSKHPAWIRIAKDRDEKAAGAEKWTRFNELATAGYGDPKSAEVWMNQGAQLNRAGVTDQEKQVVLEFAVAAKRDPERAFNIIKPVYEALQGIVGEILPQDLREAVERGEMTEEAAQRLNRSEAKQRIAGRRAQMADDTVKQRDEATAAHNAQTAMAQAVVSWEGRVSATEPDWARIAPLVNEQVTILREARQPKTPEEAVKLCDDAVAIVKKMGGVFAAPKPSVTPPSAAPSQRRQETRAKSVFEHVKRAVSA